MPSVGFGFQLVYRLGLGTVCAQLRISSFEFTHMMLRARVVVPVSAPPIPDGAVQVARGRIVTTGRWRDLQGTKDRHRIDLGQAILMPGLINAHCHLDYTLMAGLFPPPKVFTDWLKVITDTK